ncbi:MAG: molybdate ABC transporter permease subunit [Anaerolineales bacterium]|nr:molybdate ABC transporter permease subunit [Anaerolineales bacterium]MCB9144143.1 molybdate ABC transporter permease subunit [Anaerolineales bacterium]
MTRRQSTSRRIFSGGISKWIFILPSLILLAFFALPLFALVYRSIEPDFFANTLSRQAFQALKLSLGTSSLSTMITVLLGTPLAYLLARWKFKFKSWLELVIDLPIVLPPSVAGLALLIAFGRRGIFGAYLSEIGISIPFTTTAVIMAQLFVAAPLFIRSARIGFAHVDKQLEESAYVEGANQWQVFYEIMLPISARALASGTILTWTRALGEFGATILFAGNLEGVTQTMPIAIYIGFERDLGVAMALSVVLILVSVVLLILTKKIDNEEE